ncbi:hypothetical protein FALCPG4_007663 [Fusarium falciforme]
MLARVSPVHLQQYYLSHLRRLRAQLWSKLASPRLLTPLILPGQLHLRVPSLQPLWNQRPQMQLPLSLGPLQASQLKLALFQPLMKQVTPGALHRISRSLLRSSARPRLRKMPPVPPVLSPTESSTTTTSEAPATTTEAGTRLGFFNGGFEDPTVDGLPWVIGRSVEIKNDPENAHGGEHYALVQFPITGTGRPVFPLRQTVTGIDGTKKYLLTFYWTFTDVGSIEGIYCDFFTYFPGLLHGNMIRNPAQPVNQYVKRQLVASFPASTTAADILFHWKCWSPQPTWPGAEVRIDDVNVEVYDPPCTRREAPSDGLTCGVGRLNNPAAESYLIDFSSEWIHFDFCAQACAGTQGCKTFVHSGSSIATCKLYSATPQELGFQESTNGNRVNQPECYQCRPLESD